MGGDEACEDYQVESLDWFYDLRNREIYSAITSAMAKGLRIDLVILTTELRTRKMLDLVGGASRLSSLGDSTPAPSMAVSYLKSMKDSWLRRRSIQAGLELVSQGYGAAPIGEILDWAELELWKLRHPQGGQSGRMLSRIMVDTLMDIQAASEDPRSVTIPTGFRTLDNKIGGLFAGEMTVLAARPSVGKTAMMLNIVMDVAMRGIPVAVFSLEMKDRQLAIRVLAGGTGISTESMRQGKVTEMEFREIVKASSKVRNAPVWINDQCSITLPQFRSQAKKALREVGAKLIAIDYVQLMSNDTKQGQGREREMAQISSGVKAFAKEHNVSLLVLSQLNRNSAETETPKLSDLRDTGQLEQDADTVMFLHRPDPVKRKQVNICIAKQRQGPVGTVEMEFDPATSSFHCKSVIEQMGLIP